MTISSPDGHGVDTYIRVIPDAGATKDIGFVRFTTVTSPNTPQANMWGHMPDTLTASGSTVQRPYLATEKSGAVTTVVINNETWGMFTYSQANSMCTLPTSNQLSALYNAYPSNKLNTVNGWPTNQVYRSSVAAASGQHYYVYMNNGTVSYNAANNGDSLGYHVSCLLSAAPAFDAATATIASNALTAVNNNAVANGAATNSVQVIVTDANNNRVPNQSVTFTADNGATIVGTATTNSSGIATATLKNIKAGTTTVTATTNGHSQSVATVFQADISTVKMDGALVLTSLNGQLANNAAEQEVTLTLLDANDNPLSGQAATFSVKGDTSGIVLTPQSLGETNAAGKVTARFTSKSAETFTVIATLASDNSKQATTKATFIADVSTAQMVANGLTSLTNNQLANGVAKNKIQAKVVDANSNPLSGVVVTFTTTESTLASSVNNQTVTTGTDGTAQLEFATTKADKFRINAAVTSATAGTTGDFEDVTFIADISTAKIVGDRVTSLTNNQVADGVAKNKIQAQVIDANSNPVSGIVVTFTTTEATLASSVNNQTVTTASDGTAQLEFANTKAGKFRITGTVTSSKAGTSSDYEDVTFKADSTTATIASNALTVVNNNAVANNTATNSVQVIVTDANGNPVTDQTVSFTANNSATIDVSAITNSSGIATAKLKSTKFGTSQVTATFKNKSLSVDTTFAPYTLTTSPNSLGSANIPSGYDLVTYTVSNGNWLKTLILPASGAVAGNKITLVSNAVYDTYVDTANTNMSSQLLFKNNTTYSFVYNGSIWILQ